VSLPNQLIERVKALAKKSGDTALAMAALELCDIYRASVDMQLRLERVVHDGAKDRELF
jgi:hypothetical protein